MSTTTRKAIICQDCGIEEGQIHKWGCDMEVCPQCGGQLMMCACWMVYIPLEDRDIDRMDPKVAFWWQWRVEKFGRVPYIHYPNICAKCGEVDPEFFMVPHDEWDHYIEPRMRNSVLCRPCYDRIKGMIDAHKERGAS